LSDLSASSTALASLIRAELGSLNALRDALVRQTRGAGRARSLAVEAVQGIEAQQCALAAVAVGGGFGDGWRSSGYRT
jgi:hypothetical protein